MRFVILSTAALALAGCATIITGGDDDVDINTPGVAGAECEIRTFSGNVRARIVTPGTVELNKSSSDLEAICSKDGFMDGRGVVQAGFEPWFVGNLLFGGLIGIIIDMTTGNFNKYDSSVAVFMAPDGSADDGVFREPRRRAPAVDAPAPVPDAVDDERDSFESGPVASRAGPVAGDAAVYLGFARSREWADNTAEFMWVAERSLLQDVRPVVQQRIDPGTGEPRFHIYGADMNTAQANEICAGLESAGYLCRTVATVR